MLNLQRLKRLDEVDIPRRLRIAIVVTRAVSILFAELSLSFLLLLSARQREFRRLESVVVDLLPTC